MTQTNPATAAQDAAAAAAAAAAAVWEAARFRGVLPSIGSDVAYAGKGIASTADDVWNWVEGKAKQAVNLAVTVVGVTVDEATKIAAAYAGELLKAALSVVNDLAATVAGEFDIAYTTLAYVSGAIADSINGIDTIIGLVDGVVVGIENVTIPALLAEIINVAGSIEPKILDGLANVETWAIDNIYNPVQADIVRTAADIYAEVQRVADVVTAEAQSLVDGETLARLGEIAGVLATIAGLATAVGTITTWMEECGTPMCDVLGPKTDLGKFLKLLNLAGDAALIAELAALDGNGIESLLRGLVSLSNGVVGDLESLWTGGETVGGLLTGIGG